MCLLKKAASLMHLVREPDGYMFFNSYLIMYQFVLDCLFFLNSFSRKPVFGAHFYVEYIKGLDSVQTKGFSYEILPWPPNPTLSQETFKLL